MKRLFTLLFLLMGLSLYAVESVRQTNVDGYDRIYYVFTPSSFNANEQYSAMIVLHPLGMSAETFMSRFNPQAISDKNNTVVVFPEALDEQDSEIISAINALKKANALPAGAGTEKVWGAGARISLDDIKEMAGAMAPMLSMMYKGIVAAGYAELNKNVDDIKFLNTVISELQQNYSVGNTIYMAGASMGGAMTYRYAYTPNNIVSKIAVISGFVSAGTDMTHALAKPLCVFHSINDEVVNYMGGLFNGPIAQSVQSIATKNGCSSYVSMPIPDTKDDGITIYKAEYTCNQGQEVCFYLADNASHYEILNKNDNDLDYVEEVEKFFFNKQSSDNKDVKQTTITLYPNPATDELYCSAEKGEYEILNLIGQRCMKGELSGGSISISQLKEGEYIFVLQTEEEIIRTHLVVKK